MFLVTAKQMQDMDRKTIYDFGIPGRVLMENAGRGAVDFLLETFGSLNLKKIAVLAGRGNNGGDGFVMARHLMEKGLTVTVYLFASPDAVLGDAGSNMALFEKLSARSPGSALVCIQNESDFQAQIPRLRHQDLFIDALLGTGLNSDVRGVIRAAIEFLNTSGKPVFSVDLPSGLNADTGRPMGIAVRASATATFAFAKAGQILFPGNDHTGALRVIDIGIPGYLADEESLNLSLMETQDIAALFAPRAFDGHKGHYGHLLVLAGSPGKTGAAALCANAAMRCGTGLVTLGVAHSLNPMMEPLVVEPMTHPLPETNPGYLCHSGLGQIMTLLSGRQALALGPGIGTREETRKLVRGLIKACTSPLVMDADALNGIADDPDILKEKAGPVILTPHPGEMARLCRISAPSVQADRLGTARRFAAEYGVVLVLKGARTLIALPDGTVFITPTANPGMASGGMGDVLTGMIAGLCAQGLAPHDAARAGVYVHGLCADRLAERTGPFGFTASDMVRSIPRTFSRLLS